MSEINTENDIQADLDELTDFIPPADFSSFIEDNSPFIDSLLHDEINELLANTSVEDNLSEDSPQYRVFILLSRLFYINSGIVKILTKTSNVRHAFEIDFRI